MCLYVYIYICRRKIRDTEFGSGLKFLIPPSGFHSPGTALTNNTPYNPLGLSPKSRVAIMEILEKLGGKVKIVDAATKFLSVI